MRAFVYVDFSNFAIEGQRVSAVARGMVRNIRESNERGISDESWQVDFGRLRQFICGADAECGWVKLWGSRPPGDAYWEALKASGFEVRVFDRSHRKERKVDVAMAYELGIDATTFNKDDSQIVLVTGDKDFEPVVQDLVASGFSTCIAFWQHAAEELKRAATEFLALDPWLTHLAKEQPGAARPLYSTGPSVRPKRLK